MRKLLMLLAIIQFVLTASLAVAGNRFTSSYSCSDAVKTCVSSGMRKVDSFDVHRDCWEWSYTKSCNYPSKDNCKNYSQCYLVANLDCLLKDSMGSCVNLQKEFSCKSHEFENKENKTTRVDLVEKDGQESLVCSGIACIDGNCVDKSYETNGEMMDSISKLYASNNMKPDKFGNFNLFQGFGDHCSKKAVGYSNCCQVNPKGWGRNIGAKCTKDEKDLMDKRSKNLCVYVGKENKQTMGATVLVKHHFCCFGQLLDKVIQVEGRKQLGMNFGSGGSKNCRGLTLEEIDKLDWKKIDFSEFIEDFKVKFFGKYKSPNPDEISARIKGSIADIRKYDGNPSNQANNLSGWHSGIKDDSWEAEEERRLERERVKRLAMEEVERLEKERLSRLEEEEREKIERKSLKEKELAETIIKCDEQIKDWNTRGQYFYPYRSPAYENELWKVTSLQLKVSELQKQLWQGNY